MFAKKVSHSEVNQFFKLINNSRYFLYHTGLNYACVYDGDKTFTIYDTELFVKVYTRTLKTTPPLHTIKQLSENLLEEKRKHLITKEY